LLSVSTDFEIENYVRQGSIEGGTKLYLKSWGHSLNREDIYVLIGV